MGQRKCVNYTYIFDFTVDFLFSVQFSICRFKKKVCCEEKGGGDLFYPD